MCGLWACVGVVIEGEGVLLGSVRGRQMKFEYLWVGNLSLYISWKIKRVSNVWSGKWKSINSIFCLQKPVLANHSSTVKVWVIICLSSWLLLLFFNASVSVSFAGDTVQKVFLFRNSLANVNKSAVFWEFVCIYQRSP